MIEAYTGSITLAEHRPTETGDRWGSGEARIERVALLDRSGLPDDQGGQRGAPDRAPLVHDVRAGRAARLLGLPADPARAWWSATRRPGRAARCRRNWTGAGGWTWSSSSFPILPGTYDITASLTDFTLAHPYDVRRNVLRMDVDRKGLVETTGIVSLGGHWAFGP